MKAYQIMVLIIKLSWLNIEVEAEKELGILYTKWIWEYNKKTEYQKLQ